MADKDEKAEPVEGGVYEDAPGAGTYHNAKGEPVTKDGKATKKAAAVPEDEPDAKAGKKK